MRVVVVGHTGNVGSAMVRALGKDHDIEVVGVARRRPDAVGPWSRVEAHTIDVSDDHAVEPLVDAMTGADAVVQLAWALQPNHDPRSMARTNIGGLHRMLAAASRAGVPQVVVTSSVGAYSLGPKSRRVDESWPTGGIPTSHYARFKAAGERILDRFERAHPEVTVTRMRPGLVLQGDAASEIARLFIGAVTPVSILTRAGIPVVPLPSRLVSQVVHADDLASAIVAAVRRREGGAFNIAADPPFGPHDLAEILGGRWVPIRQAVVRALVDVSWRLRIQASDPGWLDLACSIPLMDTSRARDVLGWNPTIDSREALRDIVTGLARRDRQPASPSLR